jgi:hypothetical protein
LAPFLRKIAKVVKDLVWILPVIWLCSGCLMSPSIDVEEPTTNLPPEILRDELTPEDLVGVIELDTNTEIEPYCSPAVFKSDGIIDNNPKDILYYGWYLDWDPELVVNQWSIINPSVGGSVRRQGISTLVQIHDLELESEHTLLLVVADRPLKNGSNGMEFPEGSDGELDYYQWIFRPVEGTGICLNAE